MLGRAWWICSSADWMSQVPPVLGRWATWTLAPVSFATRMISGTVRCSWECDE